MIWWAMSAGVLLGMGQFGFGGIVTGAIIHAMVAWTTARTGQPWAWPVFVLALVILVCAVTPAATRYFYVDDEKPAA